MPKQMDQPLGTTSSKSDTETSAATPGTQEANLLANQYARYDPAKAQAPEWIQPTTHLVARRLRIPQGQAEEITRLALQNGRDAAYVLANLEYAATAPNAENAAELFQFLIRSNQHRQITPNSTPKMAPGVTSERSEEPGAPSGVCI